MEQEQDRSEPATPYKLKEARKRGQVAKSLEVNSLVVLATALALSYGMADQVVRESLILCQSLLTTAGNIELNSSTVFKLFRASVVGVANILWPFLLGIVVAGILSNMVQTGPIFTFYPIKPDIKRLNPVQGLKKLFSKKLLFESVKTIIKATILGFILYFVIAGLMPRILQSSGVSPEAYPSELLRSGQALAFKLILALLLIACIDLVFNRADFGKQMRMSRREVKEESKRREGDPLIRSRRRQLQQEASQRFAALRRVPAADVVITNPTHIAIAIEYQRGAMTSPQVTAKGAGDLAARIRAIARKNGVPVVENKPLARALYRDAGLGSGVPADHFPAVAKILAWIYTMRDVKGQQA